MTNRFALGNHGSGAFASPGDTLRRLVCFVASALDVPNAFVAALPASRTSDEAASVAVWLARDYGLTFDFARLDRMDDIIEKPWQYVEVMRRLWPAAPDLVALTAAAGPGLPLFDAHGHLVGHLAALSLEPGRRDLDNERLAPLLRVAAANLERWASTP
jgi:hypothetical protein